MERNLAVMFLLALYVRGDGLHVRPADAESGVSGLPAEFARQVLLFHPARRVCFYYANRVGQRERRGKIQEQVHVAARAVDYIRLSAEFANDAAHVGV